MRGGPHKAAPAPTIPAMNPIRRRCVALAGAALLPGAAAAQARVPQRAVTILVPFAPGGIADITARAVAEPMARALGQAVVVDNRPSAGSIVASQAVATARPMPLMWVMAWS